MEQVGFTKGINFINVDASLYYYYYYFFTNNYLNRKILLFFLPRGGVLALLDEKALYSIS